MKKLILAATGVTLLSLGLASCNQAPTMDAAQMQAKADSVFNAKKDAIKSEIDGVCNSNFDASVQAIADSIVNANTAKK
jgi:hypothetical protein